MPKESKSSPKKRRPVLSLAKRLESALERGGVELVIPCLLLPVRWQKKSRGLDLIVRISELFLVEIRYEGGEITEPEIIRKAEARKLIREVGDACRRYAILSRSYSKFLDKWADDPDGYERYLGPSGETKAPLGAKPITLGEGKECRPVSKVCSTS